MMAANDKKTVVVTGGTKGLGATISSHFAENGYNVYCVSRNPVDVPFGKTVVADVRNPRDLHAAACRVIEECGRLDVWVNNAGFSGWRSLGNVDEMFWDQMVETNLKGVMFGCQAAANVMGNGGVIVNISSLAGKRGSANNSVYCATKFGVNGITQALAKELGAKEIRVNAVCPVYIETDGLKEALSEKEAPPLGGEIEKYLEAFAQSQSALKRMPEAEEVAKVCLFLSSEKASAITGQCINVDCGVMPS